LVRCPRTPPSTAIQRSPLTATDTAHLPEPHLEVTGDGGIDGVIDQDALGLDRVYVQAKRYVVENAVSEPEIRAFSGSLGAAKANKGVFVTTSYFTQPAQNFAERHPFKIVLIDGERLAALMIRHNVGVRIDETLYLKKVDEDFFVDE
jgi:restriction system protein